MSAIGNYSRITPEQLAYLKQNPKLVQRFLYEDDEDDVFPPYDRGTILDLDLDIDKSWHGLHFLLNGEAWGGTKPLWNAVLGGTPFREGVTVEDRPGHFLTAPDAVWEAVRFLTPDEVTEVANALSKLTETELRAHFNVSAFKATEIYPETWDEEDEEGEFKYLLASFVVVVAFFQKAAQAGDAVLLYLD